MSMTNQPYEKAFPHTDILIIYVLLFTSGLPPLKGPRSIDTRTHTLISFVLVIVLIPTCVIEHVVTKLSWRK